MIRMLRAIEYYFPDEKTANDEMAKWKVRPNGVLTDEKTGTQIRSMVVPDPFPFLTSVPPIGELPITPVAPLPPIKREDIHAKPGGKKMSDDGLTNVAFVLDEGQWAVWGNGKKPLLVGTEKATKEFVEDNSPNDDLYIMSSDGKELVLEGGHWVEI